MDTTDVRTEALHRHDDAQADDQAPENWLAHAVRALEGAAPLDQAAAILTPAASAAAQGRHGRLLRGDWLGHALHPLLTDLPLGCWLSASLLDLLGGRHARPSAQRLVGLGLLFVPGTVAAGLADWSTVEEHPSRRIGTAHALGNTMVTALYALSWRARHRQHHVAGVAFGIGAGMLTLGTGYLGGHLSLARSTAAGERWGTTAGNDIPLVAGYPAVAQTEDGHDWKPESQS